MPSSSKSALAEALASEQPSRPGYKCKVCRLIEDLPPADAEVLVAYLSDKDKQSAQIARALQKVGHEIKQDTVSRHRRGH